MAIEYKLYIASDVDSDSLLRIVEDSLGLDHFRDPEFRSESTPSLVGREAPGFLLTAMAESQMGGEIIEEWLGFRPKLVLGFRMSKRSEDYPIAFHHVLRATSAVLMRLPDDAALALFADKALLIRRGGRVTVSNEPSSFYPEALAEIRVPYEIGRVPTAADAP